MNIHELNTQHSIGDELVFAEHSSGLVFGKVETRHCTGEFFLQGAHVTRFQDLLFMSNEAVYAPNKALRGGIPICFPWFNSHPNDPSLPAHGWARTTLWSVLKTHRSDSQIGIDLGLSKDGFDLVYQISMGNKLSARLDVRNCSQDFLDYEVALHTYLRVGSIDQVAIIGDLEQCGYYDQLTRLDSRPTSEPIRFTQETDRIYYGQAPHISINDTSKGRAIELQAEGSEATVVWNPWTEKSKRMADFGDSEYQQMCCVETANVRRRSVRLAPGQTHSTSVTLKASKQIG
jgi:glucose-6-phosphate 1-epimerase